MESFATVRDFHENTRRGVIPALLLMCFVANWALLEALHHHDDGVMHDECAVCHILAGSSSVECTHSDLPQEAAYSENPSAFVSCVTHECVTGFSARPHAPPCPS